MVVSRPLLKIATKCDRIHGTVPAMLNLGAGSQVEYCVEGTNSYAARIATTPSRRSDGTNERDNRINFNKL